MEEAVLVYLIRHAGQVVSREDLMREVWGVRNAQKTNVLPATIGRLRRKIEPDTTSPLYLVTVRGRGYRLELASGGDRVQPRRALKSVGGPRRNDISWETPFVGRGQELGDLARRLATGARLVTIVGAPGMGKTRLAWEYASHQTHTKFCVLTSCRTLDDTTRAIAESLGVPLRPNRDVLAQIGGVLRHLGTGLLILDNFEHLPSDVALAVQGLVRAAPGWVVIVTSRARLAVQDEVLLPLQALPAEDAQQLLRHAIADKRADAYQITQIANLLDGVPLALELAGARAVSLPLWLLRTRLSEGLAVLDSEREPGSRTLHGAIRWSWNLLSTPERLALVQLCAFEDSVRIDVAEQLLAGELDALSVLGALLDKSMISRHPSRPGRLVVYQAVREFVCADAPSTLEPARARTAQWACQWAAEHTAKFGLIPHAHLPLDEEKHNLRGVHQWLVATGDHRAIALVAHLGVLDTMGLLGGYLDLLRLTRLAFTPSGEPAVRMHLAFAKALRRDPIRARAEMDQGLAKVNHPALHIELLDCVASAELSAGNGTASVACSKEALKKCREHGISRLEPRVMNRLAGGYAELQRNDEAMETLRAVLASHPHVQEAGTLWHNLAVLHGLRNELDTSEQYLRKGRAIAERFGDESGCHTLDSGIAVALARRGDYAGAHELFEEVMQRDARLGQENMVGARLINAGIVALLCGATERSVVHLSTAEEQLIGLGHSGRRIASCRAYLAMALTHAGDKHRAESVAAHLEPGSLPQVDGALAHVALLRAGQASDDPGALESAKRCLARLSAMGPSETPSRLLLARMLEHCEAGAA